MRTQYIILDNNSRSVEAVHAAVSFAEAAKFSGYADIRVVFPPMLLAEIRRSDALLKRSKRLHPERYNKHKNGKRPRRQQDDLQVTMEEVLEAYADYIEIPPFSEVEHTISEAMVQHLVTQYNINMHKFYELIGNPDISIIDPEHELPLLMKDARFFASAFEICERNRTFRERLEKVGLTQDLADDAIAAWYQNLALNKPDADLMLVSQDNGLIKRIKTIHNRAYPEVSEMLAHVEVFDQPAFAHHLMTELHAMRNESQNADDARMTINACEDLCEKIAKSKHPSEPLDNEKTVASRLK